MEIANAANAPYSPEQIVNVAYNLVYSTGMFADACRDAALPPTKIGQTSKSTSPLRTANTVTPKPQPTKPATTLPMQPSPTTPTH
jgi:hypothetical protein